MRLGGSREATAEAVTNDEDDARGIQQLRGRSVVRVVDPFSAWSGVKLRSLNLRRRVRITDAEVTESMRGRTMMGSMQLRV